MTSKRRSCISAGALAALSVSALAQSQQPKLNINFPEGASRCSEVQASSGSVIARAEESFTIPRSEISVLEVNGLNHGNIRVRGWNRTDYSIEACRIAASVDNASVARLLQRVSVTRDGGRFVSSGPAGEQWATIFLINAPANASLDLKTGNGPVNLKSVTGEVKVRAQNGPISFQDCSGTIDAQSTNGPITLAGGSGDVTLTAANGPVSIRLPGEEWSGTKLVARTKNGPLSATLPHTFRSGIRLESSAGAPVNCRLDACAGASAGKAGDWRVIELKGSDPKLSFFTGTGPVSLSAPKGSPRLI